MVNPQPVTASDTASPRSPWLIAFEGTTGKIAAITALLAGITTLIEKFSGLLKGASIVVIAIGSVIAFVGVCFYIREVRRARRRAVRRPITVFIGADSYTEVEKSRFFGREDEIDSITRKLAQTELRFFILSGKSGCGKTSLIRAGLMPELQEKHNYHPIYIRLYNKPEKSLREALQEQAKSNSGEPPSQNSEASLASKSLDQSSLSDDLHAALHRVGKPLLLFIDQFEEFFTNPLSEDERKQFFTFVHDCVADESSTHAKIILSVRSDFMDDLTVLDAYIDEPFMKGNRKRVDMFDGTRARSVIELSLEYARAHGGGLVWSPQLVDRILRDLEIKHKDGGSENFNSIVLPTELQIVCQMVQAKRWSEAKDYPGKETLIRKYIEDAIETSPRPALTNRVLLELVNENGITRAKPQSAGEIASRIKDIDEALAERILNHLASPCRLANQLRRDITNGTESVYELAHEYLVTVINAIAGNVIGKSRKANVLLDEYQKRISYNTRQRIPIMHGWQIRRHATEPITPSILKAIRHSEKIFLLWVAGLILLPTILILGVRFGTVHFALNATPNASSRVVVKRGLPFLQPLLGSDDVLIDTGLSSIDLSDQGITSCEKKTIVLNLWPTNGKRWSNLLTNWRQERLFEMLGRDSTSVEAAHSLVDLGVTDNRVVNALLEFFTDRKKDVFRDGSSIIRAADVLLKLNINNEQLIQNLRHQLDTVQIDNPTSVAAIAELSRIIAMRNPYDARAVNLLLDKFDTLKLNSVRAGTILSHLGDFDINNERVVTALLDSITTERGTQSRDSIVALEKLNANEPRVRDALLAMLKRGNSCPDCKRALVRALIKFKADESVILKILYESLDSLPADDPSTAYQITDRALIAGTILQVKKDDERAITVLRRGFMRVDRFVFSLDGVYTYLRLLRDSKINDTEIIDRLFLFLEVDSGVVEIVRTLKVLGVGESRIAEALLKLNIGKMTGRNVEVLAGMSELNVKDDRVVHATPKVLPFAEGKLFVPNMRNYRPKGPREAAGAYARIVLLKPSESFDEASERLWNQLGSVEAETSFGYRRAVQYALALLAQQQVKDGTVDFTKISTLKIKVSQWKQAIEPHRRIAANETLDLIDELVEEAQLSN